MLEDLDLIRKITWAFVRSNTGVEYDDLFSEACVAYLEALPRYDPAKGKKSTYMYHCISGKLKSVLQQEARRNGHETITDDFMGVATDEPSPEQALYATERWAALLSSLSSEALLIVQLALNNEATATTPSSPRRCRGQIILQLRGLGWSWSAIWRAFREVKSHVHATS